MIEDKKSIIFHVGTIKTASTYVQKFLLDNQAAVRALGVEYILFSPPRLDLPRYANADFILDNDFDKRHVIDAIEASPCPHIVISEEGLMGRPASMMNEAFRGYSRTAIMYVRPPVDLVASWAGENAQPYNFSQEVAASGRGVVPIAEGVTYYADIYGRMIHSFLDAVEGDKALKLVIRPYDPRQFHNGDILQDLFHAAGLDDRLEALQRLIAGYSEKTANEGRSRKYGDVSACVARFAEQWGVGKLYNAALVEFVLSRCKSGDDRKVIETLSDAQMEAVVARLKEPYRRLCAKGYQDESFLDRMLPRPHGNGRPPYRPLDEAEVALALREYLSARGGAEAPAAASPNARASDAT